MPRIPAFPTLFLGLALATAAPADTVSDALQAAMDAYAAGDITAAAASVATANAGISAIQSERLAAFLPEAPDGWTREMTPDFAAGIAIMGGGTGVEMRYTNPEASSFTISIVADNPMMIGMLGMFGNEAMMASMGKVIEVEGAKIMDQDGNMMAMVGTNIVVQANGMDSAAMLPIVSAVDYNGLAALAE